MQKFTLALALLVTGIVAASSYAEAKTFTNSQSNLLAQAKPQLKQTLPAFEPRVGEMQPPSKKPANTRGSNQAQELLQRGYERFQAQDYKGAIEDLTEVLKIEPNNSDALLLRGVSYFATKNYRKAIVDLSQAIRVNPKLGTAYLYRGISYYALEDYKKAIPDLDIAAQYEPDYAEIYLIRGISYAYLGNKQKAIADLETAAKIYEKEGNNKEAQDTRELIEKIRQL